MIGIPVNPRDMIKAVIFDWGGVLIENPTEGILQYSREVLGIGAGCIHLSMERNMKCATGFCGHCQFGPAFICKDGPVFRFDRIQSNFGRMEV